MRLNGATMQGHRMSYGYLVTQHQWVLIFHDVQHAAVLNIGALADADVMHVAARHAHRPNARVFADRHVADDYRGAVDIRRGRNLWPLAAISANIRSRTHRVPRKLVSDCWSII